MKKIEDFTNNVTAWFIEWQDDDSKYALITNKKDGLGNSYVLHYSEFNFV